MKYKVNVPPTKEQGSYSCIVSNRYESYRKDALWSYNKAREHDGLPPVERMPNGTTYKAIKEVQQ